MIGEPSKPSGELKIVGAPTGVATSVRLHDDGTYEIDGDQVVAAELIEIYENLSRP